LARQRGGTPEVQYLQPLCEKGLDFWNLSAILYGKMYGSVWVFPSDRQFDGTLVSDGSGSNEEHTDHISVYALHSFLDLTRETVKSPPFNPLFIESALVDAIAVHL